jgi:hypothetical protein
MVKLYYRGMTDENGKPKIGRSARLLGVRLGTDINIEQMPVGHLDENGYLLPKLDREVRGELVAVAVTMLLERYELALANTQDYWERID